MVFDFVLLTSLPMIPTCSYLGCRFSFTLISSSGTTRVLAVRHFLRLDTWNDTNSLWKPKSIGYWTYFGEDLEWSDEDHVLGALEVVSLDLKKHYRYQGYGCVWCSWPHKPYICLENFFLRNYELVVC